MDQIVIEGLSCEAYLSAPRGSAPTPVSLCLDVRLSLNLAAAGRSGRPEDTLSLDEIVRAIVSVASGEEYELLEQVAERVARHLLDAFPVREVHLRLLRPNPLPNVEAAGVEIHRRALAHATGSVQLGGEEADVTGRALLRRALRQPRRINELAQVELHRLLEAVEHPREQIEHLLSTLTQAQVDWLPSPHRLSVGQIIHRLIELDRDAQAHVEALARGIVPEHDETTVQQSWPPHGIPLAELRSRFADLQAELAAIIEGLPPEPNEEAILSGPYGPMNFKGWLLSIAVQDAEALREIQRVTEHPDFPGAPIEVAL